LKITREFGAGTYVIGGYGEEGIVINDCVFARSLIVTPDHLNPDWQPQCLAELSEAHLELILALRPEIVLLGVDHRLRFPGRAIMRFFLQRGIGIEVMDTAAACRTFNLLMSEGRTLAAALLVR
jgi:uncharacterized protein